MMKRHDCNVLDCICLVLLLVGGLNWGLVGAFDMNVVGLAFGHMGTLARIVYVVIGLSALYTAVRWVSCSACKR